MYLFFDTETTGLALDFKAPPTDLDNWPRITQMGWQLYDKDENLINEKGYLIYPDGWEIPKEEFFINNNMSTERCMEFGTPLLEVISEFMMDLEQSEYLIAHNMQFDANVLSAELIRLNVKPTRKVEKICTMKESTDYCKLPGKWNSYKWPSLTELHTLLFKEGFEGAHDALDDVRACAKSFFELKKRNIILKS